MHVTLIAIVTAVASAVSPLGGIRQAPWFAEVSGSHGGDLIRSSRVTDRSYVAQATAGVSILQIEQTSVSEAAVSWSGPPGSYRVIAKKLKKNGSFVSGSQKTCLAQLEGTESATCQLGGLAVGRWSVRVAQVSGGLASARRIVRIQSWVQDVTDCTLDLAPVEAWPTVAQRALNQMIDQYNRNCTSTKDYELYVSLPEGLSETQIRETTRWYADALGAATRVFGDLLQSRKPIAVFYKSSAGTMCDALLDFLRKNTASAQSIANVNQSEWACKATADWKRAYANPGYAATILKIDSPRYDFAIINMGDASELKTNDPYSALMPTFQTPSHELFHLAQAANRSQGATLWWAEGGAAYVGHLTAAMQGMVSLREARDEALLAYTCTEIRRNGKSGPPNISALAGWWADAESKWWGGMVYTLGALASEYVLGTYGWEKFHSWAAGFEGKPSSYLKARSMAVFGISLNRLHRDIDRYLNETLQLNSC